MPRPNTAVRKLLGAHCSHVSSDLAKLRLFIWRAGQEEWLACLNSCSHLPARPARGRMPPTPHPHELRLLPHCTLELWKPPLLCRPPSTPLNIITSVCIAMSSVVGHPTHQQKSCYSFKRTLRKQELFPFILNSLAEATPGASLQPPEAILSQQVSPVNCRISAAIHRALWKRVWVPGEGREFNLETQAVVSAQKAMRSKDTTCPANHTSLTRTKSAGTGALPPPRHNFWVSSSDYTKYSFLQLTDQHLAKKMPNADKNRIPS